MKVKNMLHGKTKKSNGSASCVRGQSAAGATDGPTGHWPVGGWGDVNKLTAHPLGGANNWPSWYPPMGFRASGRPVSGSADVRDPGTVEIKLSRRYLLFPCDIIWTRNRVLLNWCRVGLMCGGWCPGSLFSLIHDSIDMINGINSRQQ